MTIKSKRFLPVLFALALSSLALAQQPSSEVEPTIVALEKQYNDAELRGDLAAVEKLLAGGFVRIHSDGNILAVDDLARGVKFTSIEVSEQHVHVTGETAVVVFRSKIKALIGGQSFEGDYRCERTWARENGRWLVVSYVTIQMEQSEGPALPAQVPEERPIKIKNNVFVSADLPKVKLTLDPKFKYLGKFPFDIRGIAGGYRYLWGETDQGKHLRRVFVIQVEGYYANNNGTYNYGSRNPVVLGGESYQHNVFIDDNDATGRESPGNEADLLRKFMLDHGYGFEPQVVMSRFARVVDASRKNEFILFYFENLKDYTTKKVADFPEPAVTAEHKAILEAVDKNSRKAFVVER